MNGDYMPLLSGDMCRRLRLNKVCKKIEFGSNKSNAEKHVEKYSDVFTF